jgi:hypothetical protein
MDHGDTSIFSRDFYAGLAPDGPEILAEVPRLDRTRRHWPVRPIMKRLRIPVVATLAAIVLAPSVAGPKISIVAPRLN